MVEIKFDGGSKVMKIDADTLEGGDFTRADLHRAMLDNMNLRKASFRYADMRNAYLVGADASDADMSHASLAGVDFKKGIAVGVRFYESRLYGVDLDDADFSSAKLVGAHIARASVRNLKLCEADLTNSHWEEIDFSGVDLTGCVLGNASFINCRNIDRAVGLETVRCLSPCAVDILTLRNMLEGDTDLFLRKIGFAKEELEHLRIGGRRNRGRSAIGFSGYLSVRGLGRAGTMNLKLSERLELAREKRDLIAFLSALEHMTIVGFIEEGEVPISPPDLWAFITPYSARPIDRLPLHATTLRQSQWMTECWQAAGFRDRCFLSFGSRLPWMQLLFNERDRSLCEFWEKSEKKDFVLLRGDQERMLAFTEEEYEYYAFVTDLA